MVAQPTPLLPVEFGAHRVAKEPLSFRLADEVQRALRAAGYAALGRIDVLACGDHIVLKGAVPSYHLKQLAQEIALRTAQVEAVNNELEVGREVE